MNLKQKYRICRNIRYILFLPLILVFGYLAGSLISMIFLFIGDSVNLRVIISIFLAVFMCIYILKYYFKIYKLLQYSILFIKNPKLSLTIFCIENLSLIILYLGILYIIINKYFFNDSEYANSFMTLFGFSVAPVCVLVFVITYMFNERKV